MASLYGMVIPRTVSAAQTWQRHRKTSRHLPQCLGRIDTAAAFMAVAVPWGVSGAEATAALLGGKTHTPGLSHARRHGSRVHGRSGRPLGRSWMRGPASKWSFAADVGRGEHARRAHLQRGETRSVWLSWASCKGASQVCAGWGGAKGRRTQTADATTGRRRQRG